jgi:hypothetical protein
MRFMVLVPCDQRIEAGGSFDPDVIATMGRFNVEMADAGIMLMAEGLQPTSKGAKIRFESGTTTVIDGPFTETKELIGGFWIIEVKSLDEAVAWMRRAPFPEGAELQIRQLWEMEDVLAALPADVRERARERREAQNGRGA